MAFDLSTAKPVEESSDKGFDLSTAVPVKKFSGTKDDVVASVRHEDNRHDYDSSEYEPPKDEGHLDRLKRLSIQRWKESEENKGSILGAAKNIVAPQVGALEAGAQMLTGMAGSAVGGLAGLAQGEYNVLTGSDKISAGDRVRQVQSAMTYEPRTASGKLASEMVATPFELANEGAGKVVGAAGRYQGKLADKIIGNKNNELENKLEAAGTAVGESAIPVAMTLAGGLKGKSAVRDSAASAATEKPPIPRETAELAKKAQDMGFEIPAHMFSNNKFVRMAGEFLDNLPMSGSTKAKNKIAFNRLLIKEIGGDESAEALTPGVFGKAMRKSGSTIGQIMEGTDIPVDEKLISDIGRHLKDQAKQTPEVRSIVQAYADDIANMYRDNNGVIPGKAMRTFNTALGDRIRKLPPGDLKGELSDLQEIVLDSVDRNIANAAVSKSLQQARQQYAIGKMLEPLVAKSRLEGISPQALLARETANAEGKHRMAMGAAGATGDAAAIAENFLKEQPSSGTAERGWVMNALGGVGKAAGAAAGLTVGNVYNRLSPILSKRLVEKSLPSANTLMKGLSEKPKMDVVPYVHEGEVQIPGEFPNWTYGKPEPQVTPTGVDMSAPRLPPPSAESTLAGVAGRRKFDYDMQKSLAEQAETKQSVSEQASRKPATREVILDVDPITGKMKESSKGGIKGATPEVVENTGKALDSAAKKIAAGRRFDLTAEERIAWEKTVVDLKKDVPSLRKLSDEAIANKIESRKANK